MDLRAFPPARTTPASPAHTARAEAAEIGVALTVGEDEDDVWEVGGVEQAREKHKRHEKAETHGRERSRPRAIFRLPKCGGAAGWHAALVG